MKNLKSLFDQIIFGNVNDVYGFEPNVIYLTDGFVNNIIVKGFAGQQKRKASMETRIFRATYVIVFDYTEHCLVKLYINSEKDAELKESEIILKIRQFQKSIDSREIYNYMENRKDFFSESTISFLEWEE